MSSGIFISYRRQDTRHAAGRLADDLAERFGAAQVFRDVETIDAGADFAEALQRALAACEVMLVLIGRGWTDAADAEGRRRLEQPDDWIRTEIVAALARGIRVVPVLVDDAALPAAHQLPEDLRPLLRRQAFELEDARWKSDVARLGDELAALPGLASPPGPPASPVGSGIRRRWGRPAALASAVLLLAALVAWALRPTNVGGDWAYAPDEEVYAIGQRGRALTVELRTAGRWTGVGTGRLDGRDVQLSIELGIGGPRMECRLILLDRDRLDGTCEAPGQRYPLALVRVR